MELEIWKVKVQTLIAVIGQLIMGATTLSLTTLSLTTFSITTLKLSIKDAQNK